MHTRSLTNGFPYGVRSFHRVQYTWTASLLFVYLTIYIALF